MSVSSAYGYISTYSRHSCLVHYVMVLLIPPFGGKRWSKEPYMQVTNRSTYHVKVKNYSFWII
jgi:hypothetical protein